MSRFGQKTPTGSVMLHRSLSLGAIQDPLSISDLQPTSKHHWVSPHLRSALLTCVQGAFISIVPPFQYGVRGPQKAYLRDWCSTCDPVPPLTVSLCLLTSLLQTRRVHFPFPLLETFLRFSHAPCSLSSDPKKPHLLSDTSSW